MEFKKDVKCGLGIIDETTTSSTKQSAYFRGHDAQVCYGRCAAVSVGGMGNKRKIIVFLPPNEHETVDDDTRRAQGSH